MKKNFYSMLSVALFLSAVQVATAQQGARHSLGASEVLLQKLKSETPSNGKIGQRRLQLQVSETESFTGIINVERESEDGIYLVGKIESSPSGTFYLSIENRTELEGNILFKDSEIAFSYSSDATGEAFVEEVDINEVLCINYDSPEEAPTETETGSDTLVVAKAMPIFESFPGANGVVLLDFDGHYVEGTRWENGGVIDAQPSGMDDAEIEAVWKMVSEDFAPFHLNITTDETVFNSYPMTRRMRCIITPTDDASPGAGGVAYVGSFRSNDNTPCFVFITSRIKNCGEAASHEIGHTLGLSHDGTSDVDYYRGHGSWAPIMGVGYYETITHWSKGEYDDANNTEDDLAIMSGTRYALGYKTDDHGNDMASASLLVTDEFGDISPDENNGLIERTADVDLFMFNFSGGDLNLSFAPAESYPNLDIYARLLNSTGTIVAESNPQGLSASISGTFDPGTYYISIDGTGYGNPATDGYSDYGSLGVYSISGNMPTGQVDCNGDMNGSARTDACGNCAGGNTGLEPCAGLIEGEAACDWSDGAAASTYQGFNGDGYFEFAQGTDLSAGWGLNSTTAQTAQLTIRYSNGSTSAGTASVLLNNTEALTGLEFPSTGAWDTWSSITIELTLSAGDNFVVLAPSSSEGVPLIDVIYFGAQGITPGTCERPLDCNQESGGTASVDECGTCSGGSTGIEPNSTCSQDCEGVWNGTAYEDNCSVCVEGTTGLLPCADIPDGNYLIRPVSSGHCLEGNTGVTQETCTGGSEQGWHITKSGDHYQISSVTDQMYIIVPDASQGSELSMTSGPALADVRIEDAGNSQFHIKPAANYHLFFDVYGNSLSTGASIILWIGHGGDNQLFEIIPFSVTAMDQQAFENIKVFPNPATSELIIENHTGRWSLQDITGAELSAGTESKVDISGFAPGLYFLMVNGKSIKVIKK